MTTWKNKPRCKSSHFNLMMLYLDNGNRCFDTVNEFQEGKD